MFDFMHHLYLFNALPLRRMRNHLNLVMEWLLLLLLPSYVSRVFSQLCLCQSQKANFLNMHHTYNNSQGFFEWELRQRIRLKETKRNNIYSIFIWTSEKTFTHVFCYEIMIKTKNINVCCFQVITNQTNHDYLILMTPII